MEWISDHLLIFVVITGFFSLVFPRPGMALNWAVTPILAVMVFNVSMTIKLKDIKQIVTHPLIILWGVFLQFIPMALFSLILAKVFIHSSALSTGQLLLGSLPADISAPLMVYLVGGSTAIATAMLVAAMAVTPFILPYFLTVFGGVNYKVPTSYLVFELIGIIIIPVVSGVLLNHFSEKVKKNDRAWSGIASLCYIILLFIVVSSNAKAIISLGMFALVIIFVEVLLNLFGYGISYLTKLIFKQKETYYPLLFLVSSKEFGIASAAAETMKLNSTIVIPSAFYAVVQMTSLPIMVNIIKRLNRHKST